MTTLAELARRLKPRHCRRPLPALILMTDAERLAKPEQATALLPRGSAVILRHYGDADRAALALRLSAICRRRGLMLLVADDARLAAAVRADGVHLREATLRAAPRAWTLRRGRWLLTVAAHSARAVRRAAAAGADAVLVSPVFATASHPDAPTLGVLRFAALVRTAPLPVYALGGVTATTARRLSGCGAQGLAAISALAPDTTGQPPAPSSS